MSLAAREIALSLLVLCAALAGCAGPNLGPSPPMFDGPTDFTTTPACVPTIDPSVCQPVVECRQCDAGMCGPIFNNAGCDFEDQLCAPTCGGPACRCVLGFWSCPLADAGTDCPASGPGAGP
jgi:hypothetical protein